MQLFQNLEFRLLPIENIARIATAVQVAHWMSVTNPQCHNNSVSICQEQSIVSLVVTHYKSLLAISDLKSLNRPKCLCLCLCQKLDAIKIKHTIINV